MSRDTLGNLTLLDKKPLDNYAVHSNSLGALSGVALADALKVNHTLTTLNLGENTLDAAGGAALAEVLKINNTLKLFHLDGTQIGDNGAIACIGYMDLQYILALHPYVLLDEAGGIRYVDEIGF
jgi:hypothetical protein